MNQEIVNVLNPTKLLKAWSFSKNSTGHDPSVPNSGCSPDDMKMLEIFKPYGIYFKIVSNFRLSFSLWSVELNQWSTVTDDTMLPCWVVQNWSCQSRGRSLKLINPSRPWCDFFYYFFFLSRVEQADSLLDGWFRSPPAVWVNHWAIVTHVNVSRRICLKACLIAAAKFT